MPDYTHPKDIKQKRMILQATFLWTAATGMYALWSIARIPGEETHAVFLGFSVERLVLFGALLVATLWAGGQGIKSWLDPAGFSRFSEKILDKLANPRVYGSLLIICFWGIFNGSNFIIIIAEIVEPVTLAYYLRLEPVVMWGTSLCGATLTSAYLLRFGFSLHPFESKFRRVTTFGLVFGTFLWIWIWISLSGYGIRAIDQGIGWMPLGIPLLETQVFLAWGIAMVFLSVWNWLSENPNGARWGRVLQKEGVICVIIWLAAFVLWMTQPLKANWFASEPRPPNFVFYPSSDSSVYDISAINLLLGEGFKSRGLPFTIRPLYVIFLALFHKLGGLSYEPVIWMQVAVLALIPVFLYLITKRLHSRVTGILAAMLITLRESNAIFLGDRFSDAHAKLLMPFLPTTLGVLIFIWIMVIWLQDSSKRVSLTLIAGGIVGIFMLLRPEFGVLLPFVGLAALFQLGNRRAEWGRGMILAACGLVLALTPWIWRNYQHSGTIFIDLPDYRLDLLSRRYREDPIGFFDRGPTPLPGEESETERETEAAQPILSTPVPEPFLAPTPATLLPADSDLQTESQRWLQDVTAYIRSHPLDTTRFILNHLMNNVVQTVLYLPNTNAITYSAIQSLGHRSTQKFWLECCSLVDYDRRQPYWPKWDGILPRQGVMPITLSLVLIAIGICVAWDKHKFTGMVPLFAAGGYYLINALVRNSGGRYIIPVNWFGILYYSVGLIQVTIWGISFFKKINLADTQAEGANLHGERGKDASIFRLSNLGVAIGIFLIGCSLPLAERVIPGRDSEGLLAARLSNLMRAESSFLAPEEIETLDQFVKNQGVAFSGFGLYPRWNKSGQKVSVWHHHETRFYEHLDFYLSSPIDNGVVMALEEVPKSFPHAADVVVFGCRADQVLDALAVVLYSQSGVPVEILWRSPQPDLIGCPMPNPE